jgi:hypothetical protein
MANVYQAWFEADGVPIANQSGAAGECNIRGQCAYGGEVRAVTALMSVLLDGRDAWVHVVPRPGAAAVSGRVPMNLYDANQRSHARRCLRLIGAVP